MTEIYTTPQEKVQEPVVSPDLAISVRGLSKMFGDEYAVKNLSFDFPRGKIFGLIGPSGCGKTTTVRMLTGIYTPTEGEARVLGIDPRQFSSNTRERIGYMPQLFVLYPDLSVIENLNFSASLYGIGFIRRRKIIRDLLNFVELDPHKYKLARQISGGMQRRLSLAATLIHEPELVFLDEPTAGIDPVLRNKFWEHFRTLSDSGKTLLITTQYVGEAIYCDIVGVMGQGQMIMLDTPEGLRKRALGGEVVDIQTSTPLEWDVAYQIRQIPFVQKNVEIKPDNTLRVTVDEASTAIPHLLDWFKERNIPVESINEYIPPFDDVFIQIIQESGYGQSI